MSPPPGTDTARAVKPRAFALELTKGCNLRCSYCYYADRDDAYDPAVRMTAEVAERSVDLLLRDGPDGEPVHLHFFGGEPLLNFERLRETVAYAEREAAASGKAITFEVTTNGTRLTGEVVEFLNAHRIKVGVSFDGPPEVQDAARPARGGSSYAQAVPGIRRLLESRRGTGLERETHCSVVVTRRDMDLVAIAAHLEELGFTRILLTPATDLAGRDEGIGDEQLAEVLAAFDRLADDYERRVARGAPVPATWFPTLMGRLLSGERKTHFCGGGRDYLGVAADGRVSLCYRFYEDEAFAMGDVATGIDRRVTDELDAHSLESRTACSRCWARYFCGGGCHHENVTTGGGLGEPNPVTCDVFRHTMSRTLEAWARLSRAGRLGQRQAGDRSQTPRSTMSADPARLSDDYRPRRAEGCHVRDLGDERVVYDPEAHEVVVLNATAAFIFDRCDGTRSLADLQADLEARYAAPADVLGRDLRATLSRLREKNVLS